MFEVFVETQIAQDFAHFLVIDGRQIRDAFLLNAFFHLVDDLGQILRGLFGLELRQNLLQMIQTNVRSVRHFVGGIFVVGFVVFHDVRYEMTTLQIVANENAFLLLRDQFAFPTEFAYVGVGIDVARYRGRRRRVDMKR